MKYPALTKHLPRLKSWAYLRLPYVNISLSFARNRHMLRFLKLQIGFYEAHLVWVMYNAKAIDVLFIRIK